ncbi:FAD-dependent oxidoreductase [Paraburkholderia sediminicola]|uniref:FAD-dependent oxidoreductase n=1 Tax=Paraburkholderia TaxID=1822464 RepID=UPI0038B720FA
MDADYEGTDPMPITVDVLVVGAGSAGVAAAVAAAEEGATTLLVEASGSIGGTLSGQLLEHSAGFHDIHGNQVIAGFGQRLVERLVQEGASPGHVRDDVGYTATRTPVNHVELSLVEAQFLDDAGVRVWLHAPLVDIQQDGEGLTRCFLETRNGRRVVQCRTVVDTSGDAVAARLAGAQVHQDAAAQQQPVSILFKLGGVGFEPLLAYARANPDDFRAGSTISAGQDAHVNLWGFGSLLRAAHAAGELSLERKEMHVAGWPRRSELVVNVSRYAAKMEEADWTGVAYLQLARQIMEFARWFRRRVPGCADAYVAAIGNQVGVRESARVVGLYTMTASDVLGGARFPDRIARGAFPIDIHSANQPSLSHTEQVNVDFDIPYRTLVADGLTNMFIAGRCLSSSHEANGSLRITATCFATGEAAGVAAAITARQNVHGASVPIDELQARLRARGALIRDEMHQSVK